MATWHQLRNQVSLYHTTMWTVVIDPPNKTTVCVLFNTEHQAKEFKKTQKHAYILKPKSEMNSASV